MERVDIPAARWRLHPRAAAGEGRIETRQRTADRALRDMTRFREACGVELAGAAAAVALCTAASAGSEKVAADREVAAETGAAAALHDPNLHVAAAVARVAVTRAVTSPAEQEVFTRRGDRP